MKQFFAADSLEESESQGGVDVTLLPVGTPSPLLFRCSNLFDTGVVGAAATSSVGGGVAADTKPKKRAPNGPKVPDDFDPFFCPCACTNLDRVHHYRSPIHEEWMKSKALGEAKTAAP
jgi:hypothetical protein